MNNDRIRMMEPVVIVLFPYNHSHLYGTFWNKHGTQPLVTIWKQFGAEKKGPGTNSSELQCRLGLRLRNIRWLLILLHGSRALPTATEPTQNLETKNGKKNTYQTSQGRHKFRITIWLAMNYYDLLWITLKICWHVQSSCVQMIQINK